jgi:hypothetical protein
MISLTEPNHWLGVVCQRCKLSPRDAFPFAAAVRADGDARNIDANNEIEIWQMPNDRATETGELRHG